MKKLVISFLLILSITLIIPNVNAESKARTLRELRNELAGLRNKESSNKQQQQNTKNKISYNKTSVVNKQSEILVNQQKVIDATNESAALEIEIAEGKKELESVVKNYQISKGDNLYLEYIFNAKSYEDLVYRYAISESVMGYEKQQLNKWKDKIEKNNQLKIDLAAREVVLNNQINSLAKEIDQLDNTLQDFIEESMDIKDEISSTQDLINYYVSIGCKEDQDLLECVSVNDDKYFRKPLTKGVITSYFGYRKDPITGKTNAFHSGTDIAGNPEGTSVYSIASGKVGKIIKKASCGGNQVYIYHTINGKKYTSAYLHLLAINVTLGQQVTSNTVIGTVGGGKGTRGWEQCSTGAHLHLGLGTGWYGTTYTSYSTWKANLISAKDALNLPNKGTYWYSR